MRLLFIMASSLVVLAGMPAATSTGHESLVNTLDNSAAEIEQLFESLVAVRHPERVEVLTVLLTRDTMWPEHAVGGDPVTLTSSNASLVSRTLTSVGSYVQGMSACPFVPDIAFRFVANNDVVVAFVSFECSEVMFETVDGAFLSGRLKLGSGRRPLLAVAKSALPGIEELQDVAE